MKNVLIAISLLVGFSAQAEHDIPGPQLEEKFRYLVDPADSLRVPAVTVPRVEADKGFMQMGRWIEGDYQYKGADGKFVNAKNAYIAKEAGTFVSGVGDQQKHVAYNAGDILFEISKLGWFKAPGDAPKVSLYEGLDPFEKRVCELVNQERAKRNLPLLKPVQWLMSKSRNKSRYMARSGDFQHGNPGVFENIAQGQSSPEEVMQSWMNSQGHRENILNPQLRQMGVGYASGHGGLNWTQQFYW